MVLVTPKLWQLVLALWACPILEYSGSKSTDHRVSDRHEEALCLAAALLFPSRALMRRTGETLRGTALRSSKTALGCGPVSQNRAIGKDDNHVSQIVNNTGTGGERCVSLVSNMALMWKEGVPSGKLSPSLRSIFRRITSTSDDVVNYTNGFSTKCVLAAERHNYCQTSDCCNTTRWTLQWLD